MQAHVPESQEVQEYRKSLRREAQLRLLESRVRRRLREGRLVLHKTRGKSQAALFGRYWIRDRWNVMPILHHVDLPALAQRLNVYFADLNIE
jgi:hypothetical protein